MMYVPVFLALLTTIHAGRTVFDNCENSVSGENSLDNVNINSPIYIWVQANGEATGTIKVMLKSSEDGTVIRMKIDCESGQMIVAKKPKKTWSRVGTYSVTCDMGTMPIIINNPDKSLWVGSAMYTPATYTADLSGSGELTLTGDVEVESISSGNKCTLFPLERQGTNCADMYTYYLSKCSLNSGMLIKSGYFDCSYAPHCDDEDFGVLQHGGGNTVACSDSSGNLIGDSFRTTAVEDPTTYCTTAVNSSI